MNLSPRALLGIVLLVLAACAAPVKSRYYTLSDTPPATTAAHAASAYRVGIGPVTVPEVLDRAQMMLRVAPNRYAIADGESWATPLKREVTQAVARQVGMRLPAARVTTYFQHGGQDAEYRVAIEVLRFEAVPGNSVTLEAVWTVRNRAGERLRESRTVSLEPVGSPAIDPLVSAHVRALSALSSEIAAAVNALARSNRQSEP